MKRLTAAVLIVAIIVSMAGPALAESTSTGSVAAKAGSLSDQREKADALVEKAANMRSGLMTARFVLESVETLINDKSVAESEKQNMPGLIFSTRSMLKRADTDVNALMDESIAIKKAVDDTIDSGALSDQNAADVVIISGYLNTANSDLNDCTRLIAETREQINNIESQSL